MDSMDMSENVLSDSNLEQVTSVEKMASRDWSRDKMEERFRELRNNRDTIQSIIQDLLEDFEQVPGEEELDEKWSGFLDQKGVDEDNKTPGDPLPAAYFLMTKRKVESLRKIVVWQTRLEELEKFGLEKFRNEYGELLEEYRLAKSYDTIQDALDDKAENWVVDLTEDKLSKMESMIAELEKFSQARMEERKADREAFRRLAEDAKAVDEDEIVEHLEKATSKMDDHTDAQGVVQLHPEKAEKIRSRKERDEAAESAAEDEVEDTEEFSITLKDKDSVEQRAEALAELAEEIEPIKNDMTQEEVAEHTDMTAAGIFNKNKLLDKCHDKSFYPGIDV